MTSLFINRIVQYTSRRLPFTICAFNQERVHFDNCLFSNNFKISRLLCQSNIPFRSLSTNLVLPSNKINKENTEDWKGIYVGVLTTQFRLLKIFSLSSSTLGLLAQPIVYQKIWNEKIGLLVAFSAFIGFFTFVTPLIIHMVSKKYVTKLEYNACRDIYSATTLSFFLREIKHEFKVSDVIHSGASGPFSTFKVKNSSLFVNPECFEDIEHYARIMGHDSYTKVYLEETKKQDL